MHVASLELCKELYELSGYCDPLGGEQLWWGYDHTWCIGPWRPLEKTAPAYGLSCLLRLLPEPILLRKKNGGYECSMRKGNRVWPSFNADTPEDAACKLAIELFEQGILQKGRTE